MISVLNRKVKEKLLRYMKAKEVSKCDIQIERIECKKDDHFKNK